MGFDEGRIVLDSPNGTYYSGQSIRGNLIFQQDSVKTFRGIYIKFHGFCKVHWTTTENSKINGRNVRRTVNHDSFEEYVKRKIYLIGGESGEHHIQPGNYDYPFTFQLPVHCPSSFEGIFGHVRYNIKAVIDKAFKFDQKKKVAVRVMAPLDLNMDPSCRQPIEMDLNARYYCCCFRSGSTNTVINVPVSGYCPGQKIPIEIACTNNGTVEIGHIKLRIKKKVLFIATHHPGQRQDKDVVAEIEKGPIPGNTTRNWTVEMEVPALDVYNLSACNYIHLNYKFEVVVSPNGCHRNTNESQKIIIGTIPLVGFQDNVLNPLHDQMPQQITAVVQHPPYNTSYPYPVGNGNTPHQPSNSFYPINDASHLPYPTTNLSHPTAPYPDNPPTHPGNNLPYPPAQNGTVDQMGSGKEKSKDPGSSNTSFSGANAASMTSPAPVNTYSASSPTLEPPDTEKKKENE